MSWRIAWTKAGRADLRRLDRKTAVRVIEAVERLADAGHGDVKRLQGSDPEWRLRVGKLRVRFVYETGSGVIRIRRVLPRESAYRR